MRNAANHRGGRIGALRADDAPKTPRWWKRLSTPSARSARSCLERHKAIIQDLRWPTRA